MIAASVVPAIAAARQAARMPGVALQVADVKDGSELEAGGPLACSPTSADSLRRADAMVE